MQLRYVVAQIVPDLIRQETVNVGIVLQSDEWVTCKFIRKIPKDWDIAEDFAQDVVYDLSNVWSQRLRKKSESFYMPKLKRHKRVSHTEMLFLELLSKTYNRHLRFSEVREAEVEISDAFGFETFLERLYNMFVAPKPRLRKPPVRSKLHTNLKKSFKQLKLFGDMVQERRTVEGTFPWPVDFWYRYQTNGTQIEVAIALADFGQVMFLDKVKDIFATWTDLKQMRGDSVERVSVVATVTGLDEHQKALDLLRRSSHAVYVFEAQQDKLLEHVQHDLGPVLYSRQPHTGQ